MRLLTLLLFLFTAGRCETPNLSEVRSLFLKSHFEEAACTQLVNILKSTSTETQPVLLGYHGCAIMMMAEFTYNPVKKLSSFQDGKALLEKALQLNSANPELRYLRFTVQTNVPSFLGYNKEIQDDKIFLLKTIKSVSDTELRGMITDYLKKSDQLSTTEKLQLP